MQGEPQEEYVEEADFEEANFEPLEPVDQIKKEIFEGAIVGSIEPIIVMKPEAPEESDTDIEQYDMTKVGSTRKTKKKGKK